MNIKAIKTTLLIPTSQRMEFYWLRILYLHWNICLGDSIKKWTLQIKRMVFQRHHKRKRKHITIITCLHFTTNIPFECLLNSKSWYHGCYFYIKSLKKLINAKFYSLFYFKKKLVYTIRVGFDINMNTLKLIWTIWNSNLTKRERNLRRR